MKQEVNYGLIDLCKDKTTKFHKHYQRFDNYDTKKQFPYCVQYNSICEYQKNDGKCTIDDVKEIDITKVLIQYAGSQE